MEPFRFPILSAFGMITWRRGDEVVTDTFTANLNVVQQSEYVELAQKITNNFTMLPEIDAPSTVPSQ